MRRAAVGLALAAAALATGITVAALCSQNRARGDALDRLERWCEAQARTNELARVANQRAEGELLHGSMLEGAPLERPLAESATGAATPEAAP